MLSDFILGKKYSSYVTKVLEKVTKVTLLSIFRDIGHTHRALIICEETKD